jgi:hypothetical protein
MGNIELLKKTKEYMQANPEKHNQGTWISFPSASAPLSNMCHTTMCTAGHAAVLAGAEVPTFQEYLEVGWTLNPEGKVDYCGDGVATWASDRLGLNCDEYDYLFFSLDKEELFARIDQVLALWESGQQFDYNTCEVHGDHDYD